MENDKDTLNDSESEENAPRARNRTVMLTPEITGQVRARLAQEMEGQPRNARGAGEAAPANDAREKDGFNPVVRGKSANATEGGEGKNRDAWLTRTPQAGAPSATRGPAAQEPGIHCSKETRIAGFLVSFDNNENGEVFELRVGRYIVTSEPNPTGNYLLIDDGSVSPMHAILRVGDAGDVQVLDQLSEYGTHIRKIGSDTEEQLSGEKAVLENGDILRFGKRSFHVCVMAGPPT